MQTNDNGGLQVTDVDEDEQPDHPPTRTTDEIVPVSVPREIEQEARERADALDVALEDAIADHITVIPAWCFSSAEDSPDDRTRRVALHTEVRPAVARLIDDLATDGRNKWVHEAVREKVSRETDGSGATLPNSGP